VAAIMQRPLPLAVRAGRWSGSKCLGRQRV